ncbi:Nif3-like dinuclear metal center hexameric protein [Gulosibacter sediminis]|uniref:Nif3-like dinuclear metal center hexameric protein n=1 Tax=Gulosibacter sediminis TaxID=1729695 RepID=UPI0024AE80EE|nr:Nif3-like dinuclear metal center hexameric protein [Gulosibacter sediminis]
MTSLRQLQSTLDALFPETDAEPWDAVGPAAGDPDAEVTRVLLAVDPVSATVDEALEFGAQLLVTHHPLVLRGITTLREDRYKGALLARLIREGCALHTAHTNADVVETGPTGTIFDRLGVSADSRRPIEPLASRPERGIGLIGEFAESITLREFAERVARIMPPTAGGVRVAGDPKQPIRRVACCSGAGDSLLAHPLVTSADVYLTSDLRHHPASEAREQSLLGGGPALVDVAHFASEWLWLDGLADRLRAAHPELEVRVSTRNTDPWMWHIPQRTTSASSQGQ